MFVSRPGESAGARQGSMLSVLRNLTASRLDLRQGFRVTTDIAGG